MEATGVVNQRRIERQIWGAAIGGPVCAALWSLFVAHTPWGQIFPGLLFAAAGGALVGYVALAITSKPGP